MQDYQIRVIEEKKELDAKIERLQNLPASIQITPRQHHLMSAQLYVMISYSAILGERIRDWVSYVD